MATKSDRDRKDAKAAAIVARLADIHASRDLLIGMLDETKLDLLIIALGIGTVVLADTLTEAAP